MSRDASNDSDPSLPAGAPDEWVRTIVSIVIFIHLFCVSIAVAANYGRSALEARLLSVLSPYSESLFLDLAFAQYQLTDGFPDFDDHFEIQPTTERFQPEGDPIRPDRGLRGSLTARRYQALAKRVAQVAGDDASDAFVQNIVQAVGGGVLREHGRTHAIVRVRRHATQAMNVAERRAAEDPNDPSYFATVYEANVWFDGEDLYLSKREARGESAPAGGASRLGIPPAQSPDAAAPGSNP